MPCWRPSNATGSGAPSTAMLSKMRERFGTLSAREQQVMLLVTAGKMNKQVAGDLGISEITVKIHRAAVMRKMGARTLADLIRMADVINPRLAAVALA